MPLVELRGIVRNFGGVRALKGVDATIEAGRTLVLLGENGAGKSTLIKILTGALAPDDGEIRIDGAPVTLRNPEDARRYGIAAVYQEPMTFPHMTVLENIFAGCEITSRLGLVRRPPMLDAVRPWLAALDIEEAMLSRPMGSLGLGHKQLVLIVQALVGNARLIIFDEPTSILSRAETDRLVRIIARLRDDGRAIVYITHRLEEVARVGDHVTVLTDGAVTGDHEASEISPERLLQLMAGKSRDKQAQEVAAAHATTKRARPVLEVRGLSHAVHFRDVDWAIQAGTVTGIYGLVGAGRSEVALTIFGALERSAGEIRLDGKPVRPRSPADAIALGIGYLPEDRKGQGTFGPLSLESNLTCAALPDFTGPMFVLDFRRLAAEARRMISTFSIKARDHATAIATLSGGNQQKGLFARWAARPLHVLILDEPTRGIDLGTKAEIHGFVRRLAAGGMAIVVISSDLAEILAVSARIIVMRAGRVVDLAEGDAITPERVLGAAIGAATRTA